MFQLLLMNFSGKPYVYHRNRFADIDLFDNHYNFRTFTLNITAELSPVCAIVGGILAQDILNILSQRELPINNFFIYDGFEGKYFQTSVS